MPKVGFISLGCPKNLVDSEVMLGVLTRAGYEITPRADQADILLVNTCSFIEPARQESVETILEMAEFKKSGSARKLIVAGCLVERYRDEIQREIPEVDAVIGTNELERVVDACRGAQREKTPTLEPYLYHDRTPRLQATPRHYAYLKVAEGCDHPCSFCIIPQLRGGFRSRRFESVVREAGKLAASGAQEIILIGQDTTSYGADLGLGHGLALLLERLATEVDVAWIRFLYAYPNRLTQKLLETVAEHPKLLPYFDIPFQHASASVLRRMRRGSHGEAFLRLLERVRSALPDATLRTSFIVGFPGETEQDFLELCEFVRAAEFDHVGVFTYSDEETAPSFRLPVIVSSQEAERRRRELLRIQQPIAASKNRQRLGERFPALLEGPCAETELLWEARLPAQAPEIDGELYINDTVLSEMPRSGSLVTVEITEAQGYDLIGRILKIDREPVRLVERPTGAQPLVHIEATR